MTKFWTSVQQIRKYRLKADKATAPQNMKFGSWGNTAQIHCAMNDFRKMILMMKTSTLEGSSEKQIALQEKNGL